MRRASPCGTLHKRYPSSPCEHDSPIAQRDNTTGLNKRARGVVNQIHRESVWVSNDHVDNSRDDVRASSLPLSPSHLFLSGGEHDRDSPESQRLWLPRKGSVGKLDEYLARIPRVVSRAKELLQEKEREGFPPSPPNENSYLSELLNLVDNHRCINVLQGEMAHVSADQADIVLSADATTCHVVAIRSTTPATCPLVSLAHIDRAYDSCLENMIQEHIKHHDGTFKKDLIETDYLAGFFMEDDVEDSKASHQRTSSFLPSELVFDHLFEPTLPSQPQLVPEYESSEEDQQPHSTIHMDLHIAGGYLDEGDVSQDLSTRLIERFDELAEKYSSRIRISLSTAAISSLNNDRDEAQPSKNRPKSRGLGINVHTGQVFAVKAALPSPLQGPALEIRSARVFATHSKPSLAVIHDTSCRRGEIKVNPFQYKQRPDLNVLLDVPDQVLLSVTSTSPEFESKDFCSNFRRTLSFVNTVPPETVFCNDKPIIYRRSRGALNIWKQTHDGDENDGDSDYSNAESLFF